MTYGSSGKILHVNLTTGSVRTEEIADEWSHKFIGGRGVSARLLWDLLPPKTDPMSPANVLIYGPGLLTGTIAPCSGRTNITTKSPATHRYLKTNGGGRFGAELKFSGYSHLVVYGRAPKPSFLLIQDDEVEILDAAKYWGMRVDEANDAIRSDVNDELLTTAAIGPPGERGVKFAMVNFSVHHAAGRGGAGAVMGSKNLKAIAVHGTKPVTMARPKEFYELCIELKRLLGEDPATQGLTTYGTAGFLPVVNEMGSIAYRNFSKHIMPDAHKLGGEYLVKEGYLKGRHACFACPTGCHRYATVDSGKFKGTKVGGPEFENASFLGMQLGIDDIEYVLKLNQMCNEYGLDSISTGGTLAWAMESYERGVLSKEETGGIDLRFGNGDGAIQMLEKIIEREGLGELLGEGSKVASEKIGKDSWKWAVQARGLEQSAVDTRAAKAYALAFAVNPRGPDHLHTETIAEFGLTEEAKDVVEAITGKRELADPYLTEGRAEIVRWHEDVYSVSESLGICVFTNTAAFVVNPQAMTSLLNHATGAKHSEDEAMEMGRRILTLERSFNVREGYGRRDDVLPHRFMNEKVESGPSQGLINSPEEMSKMLDRYYQLHGWDPTTGKPTREVLQSLDLDFVTEAIR